MLNKEKIFNLINGDNLTKGQLSKNEIEILKIIQATGYKTFLYHQLGVMDSEGNLQEATEVDNTINKLKNLGILKEHKEDGDIKYKITSKYFYYVNSYVEDFTTVSGGEFSIRDLVDTLKEKSFEIDESELESLVSRGILHISPEDEQKERERWLAEKINYLKNRVNEIYKLYESERSKIKQEMKRLVEYSKQIRKIRRELAPHLKDIIKNRKLSEKLCDMERYVQYARKNELSKLEKNLRVEIEPPYMNGNMCTEYLNNLKEIMSRLAEWERTYDTFRAEYSRVEDGYVKAISIGKEIAEKLGVILDD